MTKFGAAENEMTYGKICTKNAHWTLPFDDFFDFLGKSYLNSNKKVAENGKILLKNSKTKVGATCKLVNLRYYWSL